MATNLLLSLLVSVALLCAQAPAAAAEIKVVDGPNCNLRLSGLIEIGDAQKLKTLLEEQELIDQRTPSTGNDFAVDAGQANLCLDSIDGSFSEALAIVEVLAALASSQDKYVGTVVEAGARCAGPCAMVFMAGRYHAHHGANFPLRKLHPEGELVFRTISPSVAIGQDKGAVAEAFATAVRDIARMLRLNKGASMLDGSTDEHNKRFPRALVADILRLAPGQTLPVERIEQIYRWNIAMVGLPHPRTITADMLKNACEAYSDLDRSGTPERFALPKATGAIAVGTPVTRTVLPPASTVDADERQACVADLVQHPKAGPVLNISLIDDPTPARLKSEATPLAQSRKFMVEENGGDGGAHGLIGEGTWLLYPKQTRIRDLPELMRR